MEELEAAIAAHEREVNQPLPKVEWQAAQPREKDTDMRYGSKHAVNMAMKKTASKKAPAEITEFHVRKGTNRDKAFTYLKSHLNKQVPVADLAKHLYGDETKTVQLGMVIIGLYSVIANHDLPYTINKERVEGVYTVGLHKAK